MIIILR